MNPQELVKYCFLFPIYLVTFVAGLPLNAMACWVLGRTKKNSMSIYALNLATADLFYLAVVPMKIGYTFNGNNWIFPVFLCRVTTLIFFTNIYASIMILAAISVDRYKAVVHPLEVSRWREPRTAWIVCAVIWVITVAEIAPINYVTFTVMVNATNGSAPPTIKCYEKFSTSDMDFLTIYRLYLFSSLYLPSLVAMLFSYISVIKSLFKVDDQVDVMKRDKKIRAIKLTVLIISNFFVCFTTYNVSHIIGFIESRYNRMSWESLALLRDIALGLSLLNSLFDPVVAFVASSSFRNSCKNIIKCRLFKNRIEDAAT
ncbi:proteinase-activated receptor 1-like [Petromyzon marinus]|uniref:Proteinase-activated receptor 1-like n=1 Tax=Petromyzon marinus TaxID=7757 RepID=A0AAJ7WTU1_PETMA|nr:proteinase-activated receptor 1-like [Petromyzon marinus]